MRSEPLSARPRPVAGHARRYGRKPRDWQQIPPTAPKCRRFASRWLTWPLPPPSNQVVRGEVFRLPSRRRARSHEQRGARYGIVVQSDELLELSTVLVAPTSTRARAASFRPPIELNGDETRVLVEQTTVVDRERLGRSAGRLDASDLRAVDEALLLILGL